MIPTAPERRKLYGALHAAAAKAGLDDGDYRVLLQARTGKTSAKDLTDAQIRELLNHLNGGAKATGGRRRDDSPTSRKIRALWLSLHHLGIVRNQSEAALASFVKANAKVEDLRWLSGREAYRVIEALKDMGTRHGVRWDNHETPQEAIIAAQLASLAEASGAGASIHPALKAKIDWLVLNARSRSNPSIALNELVESIGQRIRQARGEDHAPTA